MHGKNCILTSIFTLSLSCCSLCSFLAEKKVGLMGKSFLKPSEYCQIRSKSKCALKGGLAFEQENHYEKKEGMENLTKMHVRCTLMLKWAQFLYNRQVGRHAILILSSCSCSFVNWFDKEKTKFHCCCRFIKCRSVNYWIIKHCCTLTIDSQFST